MLAFRVRKDGEVLFWRVEEEARSGDKASKGPVVYFQLFLDAEDFGVIRAVETANDWVLDGIQLLPFHERWLNLGLRSFLCKRALRRICAWLPRGT